MFPDRVAEALPLLCVFQRVLESCARHPQRPRSHLNTARFKAFHHLRESSARFVTEDRRGRYAAVVERQLATLHSLVPQLGEVARDGETLTMFDQNDRNALMAWHGLRIGLAQQCDQA